MFVKLFRGAGRARRQQIQSGLVNHRRSSNSVGFQERRSQQRETGREGKGKRQGLSSLCKLTRNQLYHKDSKTILHPLWLQAVVIKPVTDEGRWATGVPQELHRLCLTLSMTCSAPPATHSLQLWQKQWAQMQGMLSPHPGFPHLDAGVPLL